MVHLCRGLLMIISYPPGAQLNSVEEKRREVWDVYDGC